MKNSHWLVLIGTISILLFASCDGDRLAYASKDVPNNAWHKDSIYTFETDSVITDEYPLLFFFTARLNQAYPYRNMHMFVEIDFPNGEGIKDSIEFEIMLPNGQKGPHCVEFSGAVQKIALRYKYALKQPPSGKYIARIQQGMRDSLLPGVLDVGFKIDKFQP